MIRILRAKEWTHRRLINRGSLGHEKTKIDGAIRALTRMSHKIRRERTEIECWCGFRADEGVKLGRHPAKSRIQRSPHLRRYTGA